MSICLFIVVVIECPLQPSLSPGYPCTECSFPVSYVVVGPPLPRVAVEGSDNPRSQVSPARRPFHLASRGTTLPGDIERPSMLFEVYKCVQLKRCSVVCGFVLQRGLDRVGELGGEWAGKSEEH